jgi:HK97 family phage major capsid protein
MNMHVRGGLTAAHAAYGRKDAGDGDDQSLFKELSAALAARDKTIQEFVTKANAEAKEHGAVLTETKDALKALAADGNQLQARLLEVEQKLSRRGGAPNDQHVIKSVGEQVTDDPRFKAAFPEGSQTSGAKLRMQVKAISTITTGLNVPGGSVTGGGVGAGIAPDFRPGIITPATRPLTIRNLIMPGSTGTAAITYVVETGFQNSAAVVAETVRKPQSDITLEQRVATVKTMAHFFKVSKQALDDVAELQSYLNVRAVYGLLYVEEQEILLGDGTGQHLKGLIPSATAFNNSLRKAGDTGIDTIRRAIGQVRGAEYPADAIVLNPQDWTDIELTKNNQGSYIWSNPTVNNGKNLWGLPVVDTNAMPVGRFMTGAFGMAAQIFDRQAATVEISTENEADFVQNLATIRCEERLAMAVYRPESFVYGTMAAA